VGEGLGCGWCRGGGRGGVGLSAGPAEPAPPRRFRCVAPSLPTALTCLPLPLPRPRGQALLEDDEEQPLSTHVANAVMCTAGPAAAAVLHCRRAAPR
jgi:hypothetical protein